jgi:hypothetical protein
VTGYGSGGYVGSLPPRHRRAFFDVERQIDDVEGGGGGTGPPGPPGASGGSFTFTQMAPVMQWVITHNLGYRPAVSAFDNNNDEIVGQITHASVNALTIDFSIAVSGFALLS